jgi:hypothetical protein
MVEKIQYPFGWLAGQEATPAEVIGFLAIQMLGHRSDLMEPIHRRRALDDREREEMTHQAELLERYATVLDAIYFQMAPERWNAETCSGLLELAEKHHVVLPEWMRAVEKPSE